MAQTQEEKIKELERRILAGEDVGSSEEFDSLVEDIETGVITGQSEFPDLVDETAINEESKRILKEERTQQKMRPGLRSQTVLTSTRGERPSLLAN